MSVTINSHGITPSALPLVILNIIPIDGVK